MDEHTTKCDTGMGRNIVQVINIKYILPPTPNKSEELPQYGLQFYYRENFLWLGVYHNRQRNRRNQSLPNMQEKYNI